MEMGMLDGVRVVCRVFFYGVVVCSVYYFVRMVYEFLYQKKVTFEKTRDLTVSDSYCVTNYLAVRVTAYVLLMMSVFHIVFATLKGNTDSWMYIISVVIIILILSAKTIEVSDTEADGFKMLVRKSFHRTYRVSLKDIGIATVGLMGITVFRHDGTIMLYVPGFSKNYDMLFRSLYNHGILR